MVAVLLGPLPLAPAQTQVPENVTVYRDEHGVPHITAETEEAAWYALGFEQARDGLLWIQYACKAARGQLTWVLGNSTGINNDMAVKILGAHLGGIPEPQLRALFAPANTSGTTITANFYDNCVAFAAGANAYRLEVKNAVGLQSREGNLRTWLTANGFPLPGQSSLAWVYNDPIEPVDIASQGALTAALWSFFKAEVSLVNSNGVGFTDSDEDADAQAVLGGSSAVDPDLAGDPLNPSSTLRQLEQMRQYAASIGGMASGMSGSNSFGWSGLYCKDPATNISYPGLLADPHQAVFGFTQNFTAGFRNHMWCAHVRVTPVGATEPSFDVFGHVPHASASFLSSHNRTLAIGGTAGAPNYRNHFVLRLEEDPQGAGTPKQPHRFYSYYHDNSVSPTNATYQPIVPHSISITRPDGTSVPVPYWRAESFGFILPNFADVAAYMIAFVPYGPNLLPPPMPVLYGERVDPSQPPPRWRVDTRTFPPPAKMRYWASPQSDANGLSTSPMVVALRVPMDAAVAGNPLVPGENRHWQLTRDFWEMLHKPTVLEALDRTNGGAYPVNICMADNAGRTLSTQLCAIPKRGDDAYLVAAGYSSVDKVAMYSLGAGPVPARHSADRMFDWNFGGNGTPARPAPLQYLEYSLANPLTNITGPFKAFSMQDPNNGTSSLPPYRVTGSGASFKIEGGQFTSACNDQPWGNSRRRDVIGWNNSPTGRYANNNLTTDNWLLNKVLDEGVGYQALGLGFEAPVNQHIVVDRFARMAEYIVTSGSQNQSGLPPMTPEQMREFVVSPRLCSALDYDPLELGLANCTADPSLPTPVRQLAEVLANPTHPGAPLDRAQKEIQFFNDLWTKLFATNSSWNSHQIVDQGQPLTVNLRDLWVRGYGSVGGHPDQVFWYENPNDPATLKWIDMPSEFPLIDFLWTESEVSRGFTAGAAAAPGAVLSTIEQGVFESLVNDVLVPWEQAVSPGDRYRNVPASDGACLLEMMRMGYRGAGGFGRHWVRLRRGDVEFSSGGGTSQWVMLTSSGQLPSSSGTLERRTVGWGTLEDLAFPLTQYTTLLKGGLEPPYLALYDWNGQVKTTLGPQETNELVEFFLKLGGHYIDPAHNGNNPSRKMARWELAAQNPITFMGYLPGNYPLTGGLERATVVRALLDTASYLQSSIPQFRQHFRARAYDHTGVRLWPPTAVDAEYVGHGLRSVVWNEDASVLGYASDRGYQPKFFGMGGSYVTLLAMFPSQGGVESYFWCTPGVEAMGDDPLRFKLHMKAHAENNLMRSHFDDFAIDPASVTTHFYVPTNGGQ